jgi:hypothetical protein
MLQMLTVVLNLDVEDRLDTDECLDLSSIDFFLQHRITC